MGLGHGVGLGTFLIRCHIFFKNLEWCSSYVVTSSSSNMQDVSDTCNIFLLVSNFHQEGRASYLQGGWCCKYQERIARYLTKMLQHITNIIQLTWRRCDNVPGTSCKLLAKDFTTYQECVGSHYKKMLQRIRNIWQVTWRRVYNVSGMSRKWLTSRKLLQRIRNVLHVTWRRCYNISGTSFKLLEEDLTTCQERRANY